MMCQIRLVCFSTKLSLWIWDCWFRDKSVFPAILEFAGMWINFCSQEVLVDPGMVLVCWVQTNFVFWMTKRFFVVRGFSQTCVSWYFVNATKTLCGPSQAPCRRRQKPLRFGRPSPVPPTEPSPNFCAGCTDCQTGEISQNGYRLNGQRRTPRQP